MPRAQSLPRSLHMVLAAMGFVPAITAGPVRQAQSDDGSSLSVHYGDLKRVELRLARTGNRLSLALVTLGLSLAGSIQMLHSAGPRIWGDVPIFAMVPCNATLLLALRPVPAISSSGRI